jgi:hypothetical protein
MDERAVFMAIEVQASTLRAVHLSATTTLGYQASKFAYQLA